MDKRSLFVILMLASLLSLGMAGLVFAEGDPPSSIPPGVVCPGNHRPGMMGRGGQAILNPSAIPICGSVHATMQAALAEALGLAPEDFAARLAAGQTPPDMAAELGLTWAEWQAAMQAAHAASMGQTGLQTTPLGAAHARRMAPGRGPLRPAYPRPNSCG